MTHPLVIDEWGGYEEPDEENYETGLDYELLELLDDEGEWEDDE